MIRTCTPILVILSMNVGCGRSASVAPLPPSESRTAATPMPCASTTKVFLVTDDRARMCVEGMRDFGFNEADVAVGCGLLETVTEEDNR